VEWRETIQTFKYQRDIFFNQFDSAQGANEEQTELVKYAHVCAVPFKCEQQRSGQAANSSIKTIAVIQTSRNKNVETVLLCQNSL